jgi:hypothetical protein
MNWQLLEMILPVNGQKQESTGRTWQVAVTVAPVLSTAVQLVQWEVIPPLAGIASIAALKSIATMLPVKRTFFFISKCSLSARPMGRDRKLHPCFRLLELHSYDSRTKITRRLECVKNFGLHLQYQIGIGSRYGKQWKAPLCGSRVGR